MNSASSFHSRTALLGMLFVFGVIYRLTLSYWFPQPRIWDQDQYYGFAKGMIAEGLHGDTVRLYGYPLVLVPFIVLFGDGFGWPLTVFQAVLDAFTGILIYSIATKLFPSFPDKVSLISYSLYLTNPFTSAYVGVILTEITAIFLVTLIIFLFLQLIHRWSLALASLTAFILGYLPQVRPSFQIFCVIFLGWIVVRVVKKTRGTHSGGKMRRLILTVFFIIILSLLPYTYNAIVNVSRYRQFALQSVDNVFILTAYISLFIDRAAPPGETNFAWPAEVYSAWWDFSTPTTPQGREAMSEKYKALAWQKITSDPLAFLSSRFAKAWYIWEKHYLFPYTRQPEGIVSTAIYICNLVSIVLAFAGFMLWFFSSGVGKSPALRNSGYLIIFLIVYISAAHIFSTSEERFSLPGYPVLFLFVGFAIKRIMGYLKLRQ